jgi:predicted DsbA family dithiol-disulfide isomerase
VDRARYLADKFKDQTRLRDSQAALVQHGAAVGLTFRFDLIQRIPNSRRSHLLIAHAGRSGLQGPVKERIMQAYFAQGTDIGDLEELVRLGVEAGLTDHDARSALILREGQDGVVAAERHAASLGISGVPTFIFDGQYTLSGAQEVTALADVFDQVAAFAAARDVKP